MAYVVPSVVDKWMGDTLRSYTLLPKFGKDRDYYLQSHAEYLHSFIERFAPETTSDRHEEEELIWSVKKIQERIMKPAAHLAAEMSFSCMKYEADWSYCDDKTEILLMDMNDHEVFELEGYLMHSFNLPGVGMKEKVGDVVMFVRPPIFRVDRTGPRLMVGHPTVVVKPISRYDRHHGFR